MSPAQLKPKLLFIGSLDVAPTIGGPIQFYRHFVERGDFIFHKLIEQPEPRLSHLRTGAASLDRLVERLSRTRCFPHLYALNIWRTAGHAARALEAQAAAAKPDAIITVAFGSHGFAAQKIAKKLGVPLVTFFHDWWPDLSLESRIGIRFFDRKTRALYRESALALCVCEEMKAELGTHANARVLYPIGSEMSPATPCAPRTRPRLVYLGGMTKGYGRMLVGLARAYAATADERGWEFALFGRTHDWLREDVSFVERSGIYRGERFGPAAHAELSQADVFLAVMDFEEAAQRRVRTSFPSKFVEACAFGQPIVAWAPAYSSIAGFARRERFPALHTDAEPSSMLRAIDELVRNHPTRDANAATARRFATTTFAPARIHQQLMTAIHETLDQRAARRNP